MFECINKFLTMLKEENFAFTIPDERCRKAMGIAITEMSRHNKNFINLLNHTLRVASVSLYLSEKENANKEICFLSAIFHDVFKEEEDHELKGGEFAGKILKMLKYSQDVVEKVTESIVNHNNHNKILNTIEAKILWDADKLDKIGAAAFLRRMDEKDLKSRIEKDKGIFLYLGPSKEIYKKRIEHTNECLKNEK